MITKCTVANGSGTVESSAVDLDVTCASTYFFEDDDGTSFGVWITDGSTAGTSKLMSYSNAGSSAFVNYKSDLYFTAENAGLGELWKSDGTVAGTTLVKQFETNYDTNLMIVVNNEIFFNNANTAEGGELWKSDGTEAGTTLLKDINPGVAPSNP